ncbi:MAG: helix-turn-helix domain-containing protein [Dehalococcoidia bacterium]
MNRWVPWRSLGERLRAARARTGLFQRDVAFRLGVQRGMYGQYELGIARPSRERLAAMATMLDLDLTELLILAGYEPPRRTYDR